MDAIERAAVLELIANYRTKPNYGYGEFMADFNALPAIAAGVKVDAKALESANILIKRNGIGTYWEEIVCMARELIRIAEAGQDAGPPPPVAPVADAGESIHRWETAEIAALQKRLDNAEELHRLAENTARVAAERNGELKTQLRITTNALDIANREHAELLARVRKAVGA